MAEKQSKPCHAIVIPLPYQGIINPFVNFALKIASKGFKVTFVQLEFIHHRLSKAHHDGTARVDFFSEARESGLDIRCVTISDGFPLDFDRDLDFNMYWDFLVRDFPARVDECVGNVIKNDSNSAYFLVSEPLSAWLVTVAEKYKLVNVLFSTMAASVFCLTYHLDLLKENGHLHSKENKDVEIDYIPGIKPINTRDLMPYLDEDHILFESIYTAFKDAKKADFILHNTVQELEPETLSSLNILYQPNYAIGPTFFFKSTIHTSFWPKSDCASWLASKPTDSVLYISFGSLVQISKHVIEEIAHGLLLSGVNFLWVVREGVLGSSDDATSVLPVGFESEIKQGKGLIVPWCDQISVLSSRAVGGFLTHCGWNSTVESMWCGVPMICYPVAYDQPTNRKLVVNDWKIGVDLCDQGMIVDRNEIDERIKSFMSGEMGKELRQEAKKVKEKFRNALSNGGSSEENFDRFISDLKEKLAC
ncbi:UDP-glycosyltransferase 86A1 [Striga hermonthica]|uniref:Glycosyltransferase n=1 Tax=Striga hermonthica TaxID=68872 RepID=A0A9N7NGE4_STRHE|nr:UDP-glycosyltransferase 86A1 [Striga hermonthica]